jgi:imidazolonepropionase-like amidohydrolase
LLVLAACAGAPRGPAAPASPSATLAIAGVRVFDGEKVIPRATVLVAGDRIAAVAADLTVPPGITVVDGAGRTLLPGLIDSHAHVWSPAPLEQALAFGVTTVLDMFMPVDLMKRLRGEDDAGRADLRSGGILATAPGGHGTQFGVAIPTLTRPEEAQAFVDARLADGSDYIKIIFDDGRSLGKERRVPTLDRRTVAALITAAHARGRLAVVHVSDQEAARAALEDGADGLVHAFGDSLPRPDFGAFVAARGAFVVPTLALQMSTFGETGTLRDEDRRSPLLSPDARTRLARSIPTRALGPKDTFPTLIAQLRDARATILAGSDAPNPGTAHGLSVHDELAVLVAMGLTPLQALTSATAAPARAFRLADRGRIAAGLRADLVLVDGDPTSDILATRAIIAIWRGGRRFDRDAFGARVAELARRAEAVARGDVGLISDFADGPTRTRFGQEWTATTDAATGGASRVSLTSEGGALLIRGELVAGKAPAPWAGVIFMPGTTPWEEVDLSSKKGLRFRAKGDGKPYIVKLHFSRRREPLVHTFQPPRAFEVIEVPWTAFGALDPSKVTAIVIAQASAPGSFSLLVDDVELY